MRLGYWRQRNDVSSFAPPGVSRAGLFCVWTLAHEFLKNDVKTNS
jgi:hypothetical protein